MGLTILDWSVLLGYFVIVAVIGILSSRLVKNREDYLMGGRRFEKTMMIMFTFGAGTHADSAVGVVAQSYRVGLSGIWYQWVMIFTLPLYWLLAPIFRRSRVLTTADFFEARFGTPMMYLYSVFALFLLLSYNGVMLFGSGKLIEALTRNTISWQMAVAIMAAVSFFYGIAGGLIAAVWNDFFQGILTIGMSVLLLPFFWVEIGGSAGIQAKLAESQHPNISHLFDLVLSEDMTLFWIVMMTLASLVNMVSQPQIMASAASGKSELDCRIGFVGGMILKRIMTVPWALTGVMAVLLLGYSEQTDADHVFGLVSLKLLPAGCIGLLLACVMASIMDNCAVNMLSFAGIYTNSIHCRLVNTNAEERSLVRISRIASLGFAICSLLLSYLFTDVPGAMRFLWQTVPLMGIPWFFAILWRRANRWGAMASFLAALIASGVAVFVLGWNGDQGLPYTILLYMTSGILAGIVVSLLTPPELACRTDRFVLLLKTPIGQEHVLREAGFQAMPESDTFAVPSEAELAKYKQHFELKHWLDRLVNDASRRQSIVGVVVLVSVMLAMVGFVKALSMGLSSLLP